MRITTTTLLLALAACGSTPGGSRRTTTTITLELAEKRAAWLPADEVRLRATVKIDGRTAASEEVSFTADPADRATLATKNGQEATFVLATPGPLSFRACLVSAPARCGDVAITVDDGSPQLVVEEPAPGAEIDDPRGIVVRGSARDGTGTLQVFVNGMAATVDAQGRFEAVVPPRFGVEHLEVVADDSVSEPTTVELDVLYAAAFTAATSLDGKPRVLLDDAAGLWLGQDFFDDGVKVDLGERPLVTRDLADLIELAASTVSLDGALPDPLIDSGGTVIRVTSSELGPPAAEIVLQDGGIDLFVRMTGLKLTTAGSIGIAGEPHDAAGTITGQVVLHAEIAVSKAGPEEEVQVEITQVDVGLESLDGAFSDPVVDAVFGLAGGFLRETLELQLRESVGALLESTLPAMLSSLLSGIDHALEDRTLTIGSAPLPPVTLHLDGRMSDVAVTYRGALTAPLVVELRSDAMNVHPTSRGVARIEAEPRGLQFFDEGVVQIGVSAAFLDGLLHVLWSSGLLDLDLAAVVPQAAALLDEAELVPRLPPVLRPPREGETNDLVLTLGQLELDAVLDGAPLRFGINLEVGADLALEGDSLKVSLADEPEVLVWAISGDPASGLSPEVVKQALLFAWPQLSGALGSLVAIQLPLIPSDAFADLSPELAGLELKVEQTDPRLYARGESLLIRAAITGNLP